MGLFLLDGFSIMEDRLLVIFFISVFNRTYSIVAMSKFNPLKSEQDNNDYDACLPKKCCSIAIVTDSLIYNGDNPTGELKETWIFGLGP